MKISIIIPTVGRDTLSRVIHGIQNCSGYDEIDTEIIVVFNGSPNQALDFPKDVQILRMSEKVWAGEARNEGIEASTGDVIVFLGDDTVPSVEWLARLHEFHESNPYKECALLGMIQWDFEYQQDPFYQWLLNHSQFEFSSLKWKSPSWKHFYTSNISLKRSLIGEERFSKAFEGWGFEDSEFGYRLEQDGMRITFDKDCLVYHDHEMTMEDVIKRTHSARRNAEIFESLHPSVLVQPSGLKKVLLQIIIWSTSPFTWIKSVKWWRTWKKAWIGV